MSATKKIIACAIIASLFLTSCVSHRAFMLPPEYRQDTEIMGTVSVRFGSIQFLHIKNKSKLENKAHSLLLQEAQLKYGADVDVVNISMRGQYGGTNILLFWALYIGVLMNHQNITATGEVVRRSTAPHIPAQPNQTPAAPTAPRLPGTRPVASRSTAGLDRAAATVVNTFIQRLPQGSTLAVLNITSNDNELSLRAIDELEFLLVNSGNFTIVDRKRLDDIRAEQNFQMDGDVDDATIVQIGRLTGASIVLTGQIIASDGGRQRLSVKALDLRTAAVLSMERADF